MTNSPRYKISDVENILLESLKLSDYPFIESLWNLLPIKYDQIMYSGVFNYIFNIINQNNYTYPIKSKNPLTLHEEVLFTAPDWQKERDYKNLSFILSTQAKKDSLDYFSKHPDSLLQLISNGHNDLIKLIFSEHLTNEFINVHAKKIFKQAIETRDIVTFITVAQYFSIDFLEEYRTTLTQQKDKISNLSFISNKKEFLTHCVYSLSNLILNKKLTLSLTHNKVHKKQIVKI